MAHAKQIIEDGELELFHQLLALLKKRGFEKPSGVGGRDIVVAISHAPQYVALINVFNGTIYVYIHDGKMGRVDAVRFISAEGAVDFIDNFREKVASELSDLSNEIKLEALRPSLFPSLDDIKRNSRKLAERLKKAGFEARPSPDVTGLVSGNAWVDVDFGARTVRVRESYHMPGRCTIWFISEFPGGRVRCTAMDVLENELEDIRWELTSKMTDLANEIKLDETVQQVEAWLKSHGFKVRPLSNYHCVVDLGPIEAHLMEFGWKGSSELFYVDFTLPGSRPTQNWRLLNRELGFGHEPRDRDDLLSIFATAQKGAAGVLSDLADEINSSMSESKKAINLVCERDDIGKLPMSGAAKRYARMHGLKMMVAPYSRNLRTKLTAIEVNRGVTKGFANRDAAGAVKNTLRESEPDMDASFADLEDAKANEIAIRKEKEAKLAAKVLAQEYLRGGQEVSFRTWVNDLYGDHPAFEALFDVIADNTDDDGDDDGCAAEDAAIRKVIAYGREIVNARRLRTK